MANLLEDIQTQADWIVRAFNADNLPLDYSIHSLIEIDRFFHKHVKDGKAVKGGRLATNLGPILFGIGSYIGQTIIRNVPGAVWHTDDSDPEGEVNATVELPDGTTIFPMHRAIKRFRNGSEDAIYVYGYHMAKAYIGEPFDQSFWEIGAGGDARARKPWWKFW